MLSTSEARTRTAPQPPSQFPAKRNFHLVQLSLGGLSQAGVHSAPQGLDQSVGIHCENSLLRLGFSDFRRVSVPRRCAHGRAALRLPGAKGSSEWSTRIDQRQICATRTSGEMFWVGVVVLFICWARVRKLTKLYLKTLTRPLKIKHQIIWSHKYQNLWSLRPTTPQINKQTKQHFETPIKLVALLQTLQFSYC